MVVHNIGQNDDIASLNTRQSLNLLHDFSNNVYSELIEDHNIDSKYYNESSFIASLNTDSFYCLSLNAHGLPQKHSQIVNIVDRLRQARTIPSAFCIQEAWIPQHFGNSLDIDGFKLFFNRRSNQRKGFDRGGTAIYIREDYVSKQIQHDTFFHQHILESTVVKVEIPGIKKFIIVSCYRPNTHPTLNDNDQINLAIDYLQGMMDKLSEYDLPIILMGDFNIDLLKNNIINDKSIDFLDSLAAYGFIPFISRATRIENRIGADMQVTQSATLIDNILLNDLFTSVTNSGINIDTPSDHFMTFITLDFKNCATKRPLFRYARSMCNEKKEAFKNALQNQNWGEVTNKQCPNEACDSFLDTFTSLFNIHFPIVKIKNNKNIHPQNSFMTKGLMKSRKKKFDMAKKARTNPNLVDEQYFRYYKDLYNSLLTAAKKLNTAYRIREAGDNSKKIWGVYKQAMNIKKSNAKIGPIRHNDDLIHNDTIKANIFNEKFSNIGREARRDIPQTDKNFADYLPPRSQRNIFLYDINPTLMGHYIRCLKPKDSLDINGISARFLHFISDEIKTPLCHIYNRCINTGKFPENFKTSKTIPIYKKGDQLDTENYRGVSLIDNFSKVFEKILAFKLYDYLEKRKFFDKNQFGFRPKMSTNHAILKVLNHITKQLNDGLTILAVFLDVSKAFDAIDHNILLSKLDHYGIRGLAKDLFKSYFEGRKQRVCINGKLSENTCDITTGVLQGSILGVLLFIIYINDIHNACPDLLQVLFADDNTALISDQSLDNLIERSNNSINKLLEWYNANQLPLHPGKSRAMIFHPSSRENNLPKKDGFDYFPLTLNYNNPNENDLEKLLQITFVPNKDESSFKLLGVLIDNKLSMKDHCISVHSKVSKSIFAISQLKNMLDKEHLKILANAYIKSHVEYCSNILCLANEATKKPLNIALKRTIRTICNVNRFTHTPPLFKAEYFLPLDEIITFNTAIFMHSYFYKYMPDTFKLTWSTNIEVSNRENRNANDFYAEQFRLISYKSHPYFNFPEVWNELPNFLKLTPEKSKFKLELKKYLLSKLTVNPARNTLPFQA